MPHSHRPRRSSTEERTTFDTLAISLRIAWDHRAVFGRPPEVVAADRGFPAQGREARLQAAGVKHAVIPWKGPAPAERRALEHSRVWKRRYCWRAGIEGRMHSLRRDYGLKRCRDHGEEGMERCIGWGILASNLWHIGQAGTKRVRKAA